MSWMKCYECDHVFDESDAGTYRENHYEIAQDGTVPFEEFQACPACGSPELERLETCPVCGGPLIGGKTICMKCGSDLLRTINAWIEENTEPGTDLMDARNAAFDFLYFDTQEE